MNNARSNLLAWSRWKLIVNKGCARKRHLSFVLPVPNRLLDNRLWRITWSTHLLPLILFCQIKFNTRGDVQATYNDELFLSFIQRRIYKLFAQLPYLLYLLLKSRSAISNYCNSCCYDNSIPRNVRYFTPRSLRNQKTYNTN